MHPIGMRNFLEKKAIESGCKNQFKINKFVDKHLVIIDRSFRELVNLEKPLSEKVEHNFATIRNIIGTRYASTCYKNLTAWNILYKTSDKPLSQATADELNDKQNKSVYQAKSSTYILDKRYYKTEIEETEVLDATIYNKFQKTKYDYLVTLFKGKGTPRKILNSYFYFTFNKKELSSKIEYLKAQTESNNKKTYYDNVYSDCVAMSKADSVKDLALIPSFFLFPHKRTGRVYHFATSLPREIRKLIRLNGQKTIEIDKSASQPTLLAASYLEKKKEWSDNDKRLRHCIINGLFYQELVKTADQYYIEEIADLFESDYKAFKGLVMRSLYKKDYDLNELSNKINKALKSINNAQTEEAKAKAQSRLLSLQMDKIIYLTFPKYFESIMLSKRIAGYKYISRRGQTLESSIFIKHYFARVNLSTHLERSGDETQSTLPIHDGLIIDESRKEEVLSTLSQAMMKIFPSVFTTLEETKLGFSVE